MSAGKDWIYQTNIYEVNIRQYTEEGSFSAFSAHLPRLREMGVETLWFMPVTPIAQEKKKGSLGSYYACSDYKAVNPEFGSTHDFKKLVDEAHEKGFKVIIDWVANHTGWDHVWTKAHPEWYLREANGEFVKASGMDDIIELDFTSREMRIEMISAMNWWIEQFDIDGFRCDLAFWVELDFWKEAIPLLNQRKPLFWLAEMDPLEHPDYMEVFDAAYSWTWMHKTEEWYRKSAPLDMLIKVLGDYEDCPGIKAWFTSNHDENSWNGSEYEKYGAAAAALAVHSCTWPGIPLVYSGQEIPNTKRLLFFDKDALNWTSLPSLHSFYETLLTLKRQHPALDARSDMYRVHSTADHHVLAYLRKSGASEVLVILNLSAHHTRFDLLSSWLIGQFREIFTGEMMDLTTQRHFVMKPWQYLVFDQLNQQQ